MYRALACLLLWLLVPLQPIAGQTSIPSTSEVFADDFERGTLEDWSLTLESALSLVGSVGPSGSTALEVTLSESESHLTRGIRRDVARAPEAYLSFWFDPDGAVLNDPGSGFIPNRAVQIGAIRGPGRGNMVAIRVREVAGGFEGFLEWRNETDTEQYDFADGSFPIASGWQRITIGFRVDGWVACWIDGSLERSVSSGVAHLEPYASIIEVGKTNPAVGISPSGFLRFDEALFHIPRFSDLWVDGSSGSDSADGLTPGTALATISRASDLAAADTVVHVLPGIYRESIVPAQGGLVGQPVIYKAENGPGTVTVRGSEASSALTWTRLQANTIGLPPSVPPSKIWWTDLSSWSLDAPPVFVARLSQTGNLAERLPAAREPDWSVPDLQRRSSQWWIANGGSSVASCIPSPADPECDAASRSFRQLTDNANDTAIAGIESGNLTTLGSLQGATLFVRDAVWGHRLYRRTIVAHQVAAGRITVDVDCVEANTSGPGLGWGSRYFVEQHPALLDSAGEWWFDPSTDRLYLWPPSPGNPGNQPIEISLRETGFDFQDRSHIIVQDLDFEYFNGDVIQDQNWSWLKSVGNRVAGCRLRHSDRGFLISQAVEAGSHADKRTEGFEIVDNEIAHMDHEAIRVTHIWDNNSHPDSWVRSGTFDTLIRGNSIHDIGFRPRDTTDNRAAILAISADRLFIEDNTLSDLGHDGIQINRSVVQSPDTWGFSRSEVQTGEILIRGNVVERSCQLMSDCGALRILASAPDKHVFKDFLVTRNSFRDTLAWSWASQERGRWSAAQMLGAAGMGIYLDHASGVHAYRNITYNNGFAGIHLAGVWRDGTVHFYNNVAANNGIGIHFGGLFEDTHVDVDTRVVNNILVNNEAYGLGLSTLDSDFTNTTVDNNLYFGNGWKGHVPQPGILRIQKNGVDDYLQTLSEVRAATSFEDSGQAVNPQFVRYDFGDHDPFDGSRPDLRLLLGSPGIDAGTSSRPSSLNDLLMLFGIEDLRVGGFWDQGRFEGGVDCLDVTVNSLTVTGQQSFEACGVLTLGPSFRITTTGAVTATAGEHVTLTSGFSVEQGGSLSLGVAPPPD